VIYVNVPGGEAFLRLLLNLNIYCIRYKFVVSGAVAVSAGEREAAKQVTDVNYCVYTSYGRRLERIDPVAFRTLQSLPTSPASLRHSSTPGCIREVSCREIRNDNAERSR